MSLAKSFSELVTESLAQPSARPSVLPIEAVRELREGSHRRTRTRAKIATGLAASLELAFFLGVGGMMAAGALLFR